MRFSKIFLIIAATASWSMADTIMFHDGHSVDGSFLGGDARSIRVAVGDHVETYSISDVAGITFGAAPSAAATRQERREARREAVREALNPPPAPAPPPPDQPPPPPAAGPMLASGTVLTVRMVDSVDSQRDQVGYTYRASLDEPVMDPNGNTLIPRGADVVVKLVDDQQSGKIAGRTVLTLDLVSVTVNGRVVPVDTQTITEQSSSRTARSGKVIGGTAVLGAIIGAVAGGGKGAAIGAASGAGVGTAAEVATKGQRVHIPSETRLTFTLQQPVQF